MRYVVGIITDKERVLLLKKNNPDWQKGLYNGVGGKVELEETPLEAIIKQCNKEVGLNVINWSEIETNILNNGIELTYFFAILEKEEIEKAQSLQGERVELFSIDNLPKNVLKDIKEHIDKLFLELKKGNKRIKKILIFSLIIISLSLFSLMTYGKVAKGNFLYFLAKEKAQEDPDKKVKFKKGFYERMGITE